MKHNFVQDINIQGFKRDYVEHAEIWALGRKNLNRVIIDSSSKFVEVNLLIDNSTGILPIKYNTVKICRRMWLHLNFPLEYYINGISCRLQDIKSLTSNL